MKRIIATILSLAIAFSVSVCVTGCGSSNKWTEPTLTTWGSVKNVGGFIAETDNYIYYINGMGSNKDDNTFGAPVKGSLMVAKKSTIGTDAVETEVVVPKLFVASDYNAGVYIYGSGEETYVYYGTPNTATSSSGSVANTELTFKRTRLDGKNEQTFFTINSLSAEYRIVEKEGVVYIVYYDAEETALKSYNTETKQAIIIAKTDEKAPGVNAMSLKSYNFVDNNSLSNAVVYYSVTVYNSEYYEDKASTDGYKRTEASYNYIYAYNVGDQVGQDGFAGTKILDGQANSTIYETIYCKNGYFAYSATDINAKVENYIVKISELGDASKHLKVNKVENITQDMIIVSPEEVYIIVDKKSGESTVKEVVKTTLIGEETNVRTKVVLVDSVFQLLFVKGSMLYYYNASNHLARIEMLNEQAKEQRISYETVATSWYKPEIVEIDGKEYIFYCDSSTVGSSYISYVDLGGNVVGEDTNNDDEEDLFKLEGNKFIGKKLAKDIANVAIEKINAIPSGELKYSVDSEGNLFVESVQEARNAYNELEAEAKTFVKDSYLKTLESAETAVELARKLYKLEGISKYELADETKQAAFKQAYNDIKAFKATFATTADWTSALSKVENNLKANMTTASKIFEAEDKKS